MRSVKWDHIPLTYRHQFSKSSPKFEPFVYWYVVLLMPFNISTNYSVDGWCEPFLADLSFIEEAI